MNIGTVTSPVCGAIKSEDEAQTRISLSSVKGRNDSGPSLSMYKGDPSTIKVVQLLSKDHLTSHRQKYTYLLENNCAGFKSVTYTLGTLQTEVTKEKCNHIERDFVSDEIVHLAVNQLCEKYFSGVEETIEVASKKESSARKE